MRYIDAEKIEYHELSVCGGHGLNCEYTVAYKHEVDAIPTADVVPKSEYDAVVSALDNSTKEFLKLHDDYQEAKREIDKWKGRSIDWYEVAYLKSQRILELEAELYKEKGKVEQIFEEIENRLLPSNTSGEFRGDSIEWFDYYDLHLAEDIAEFKNRYIPQNDDRCVVCGEIVPEGRQVCPKCQIEKGD